jgi:flagellar biosynthetic protein FliO
MSPHYSWTQVWGLLRPQLKKLARQPLVWLTGLGLLGMLVAEASLQLHAPSAAAVPAALVGQDTQPDLFSNVSLIVSVCVKLALVIALIYGSLYVVRRWQGGWFTPRKKHVTLLESTRLSPRQTLHLVRVGEQVLLVGATDQSVTLLTTVALPAQSEVEAAAPQSRPVPPAFAAALDCALTQPEVVTRMPNGSPSAC